MLRDIFLYIHNPLDETLLDRCLESLLQGQSESLEWNTLYLYNAGTLIDTDTVVEKLQSIECKNFFCNDLVIVPFDESTPKSLSADLEYFSRYWKSVNEEESQILFLKIDYALSKNFHKTVKGLQGQNDFLMSLPVYNCKEWVTEEDFYSLLNSDEYLSIGEGIYYRGGDAGGEEGNPFDELREDVKFISYDGSFDYNCHYISSDNLKYFIGGNKNNVSVSDKLTTIGRQSRVFKSKNCFVAHTWHPVNWHDGNVIFKQPEKSSYRPDDRKNTVGQRY